MMMGCATCNPNPTIADIGALLSEHNHSVLARYLRIQVEEKDVTEEQSFIDDANLRVTENDLREGREITRGRILLLVEEIKRLWLELADFEMLCDHTAQIYDWATRGVISKPTTLPDRVIAVAEDRINQDIEDLLEERTRNVRELLPVLMDLLNSAFSTVPQSTLRLLEKRVMDAMNELPNPRKVQKWDTQVQATFIEEKE